MGLARPREPTRKGDCGINRAAVYAAKGPCAGAGARQGVMRLNLRAKKDSREHTIYVGRDSGSRRLAPLGCKGLGPFTAQQGLQQFAGRRRHDKVKPPMVYCRSW